MRPNRLLLATLLILAGCPGPLRPREEDPGNGPGLPDPPAADVQPLPEAPGRLAAGLSAGDRIVREADIRADMRRVGETKDLPPGQVVRSVIHRVRRYQDEILAVGDGSPTSVRRTYLKSFERTETEVTGAGTRRTEGTQPIEGVQVKLTQSGDSARVESESLPPGVTEANLDDVLIVDTVALAAFVPGREVAPGESWTVPIERVTSILGKQPRGATYAGSIHCRFVRRVRYGSLDCAHVALVVDLEQRERSTSEIPYAKRTKMVLEGEMYYAFAAGRPAYVRISGPMTIDFEPEGTAPSPILGSAFTLQGELSITITFEELAG